jgi:hypothetical protein
MISRTQWKVAYKHAHEDAKGAAADKLLQRYVASWDFRNKLEESNISCPAPLSDSILLEGKTNIFEVHIEPVDGFIDTTDAGSEVSVPFNNGEYDADLYVFYMIDKSDEPWEPHFIRIASERLLTHHGDPRGDRVYCSIRWLWRWNKFLGRLRNDLRSPSI